MKSKSEGQHPLKVYADRNPMQCPSRVIPGFTYIWKRDDHWHKVLITAVLKDKAVGFPCTSHENGEKNRLKAEKAEYSVEDLYL